MGLKNEEKLSKGNTGEHSPDLESGDLLCVKILEENKKKRLITYNWKLSRDSKQYTPD